MKTVFYGTPEVAVPFLELLAKSTGVAAVVSQPDRPSGRDLQTRHTPVKRKALELGLRVLQPERPSEIAAELGEVDFAVAVAYGRILKKDLLAVPKLGTLNVHFSLLPKYRGAAPVQWSLVKGETMTGVTVFWLDEGMDTGPVMVKREVEITGEDDAITLMEKSAAKGLAALSEAIERIKRGEISKIPQSGEASLAPLIKKEDGLIDLSRSAAEIHNLVRGFCVWPKAFLPLEKRVIVLKTKPGDPTIKGKAGQILAVEPSGGVLVQCGLGQLWFLSVQPEGKKPVNAADFINGLRLRAGDFLPIYR